MNKPFGIEYLEPMSQDVTEVYGQTGCTFGWTFSDGGKTKVMDAFCP